MGSNKILRVRSSEVTFGSPFQNSAIASAKTQKTQSGMGGVARAGLGGELLEVASRGVLEDSQAEFGQNR